MNKDYKVITLCGSTRFKTEFENIAKWLNLKGNIILSLNLFGHCGDDEVYKGDNKEMLDYLQLRKIDMSDEIFVINKDNYIGKSTAKEIEYAKLKDMPIKYYTDYFNDSESGIYSVTADIFEYFNDNSDIIIKYQKEIKDLINQIYSSIEVSGGKDCPETVIYLFRIHIEEEFEFPGSIVKDLLDIYAKYLDKIVIFGNTLANMEKYEVRSIVIERLNKYEMKIRKSIVEEFKSIASSKLDVFLEEDKL